MSQQNWGRKRCQTFLDRHKIGELKLLGDLTERQRQLLADHLNVPSPNPAARTRVPAPAP